MRIYVAGPYGADDWEQQSINIEQARDATAELYRKGHTPFCPHSMTSFFDEDYPDIPREVYLRTDLEWLGLCDAVLLLPGWRDSEGTTYEYAEACHSSKEIFYSLDEVPDA